MGQGLVVIATVAIAILVGQHFPLLGAFVATFPTKIFAYAVASAPESAIEGMQGLLIGSLASTACVIAMRLTMHAGLAAALGIGLATWSLVALLGRTLT